MAVESSNSGIVVTDNRLSDNPIIFCNQAFENLTGYSKEEIIGRNCRFLQRSDNQQGSLMLLKDAISSGRAVTIELVNYQKDGSAFWNELSIAPVKDSEGIVTHFIGIQNDISKKKSMEIDLMQQIELLSKQVEKQNIYIKKVEDVMSHILQGNTDCIVFLDDRLNLVKANWCFYQLFQLNVQVVKNVSFMEIQNGVWNISALQSLLHGVLNEDSKFKDFEVNLTKETTRCNEAIISGKKVNFEGVSKDFILLNIKCKSKKADTKNSMLKISQ